MPIVVAVAGGSGNLGRAIVDAIKVEGGFEVLVLSRGASQHSEVELGARLVNVDYASVNGLVEALEANNVHTVLSAMNMMHDPEPELNLIKASDQHAQSSPIAQAKLTTAQQLEETSLEYTVWYTGYFLDYFVAPHVKTYMRPSSIVIDMAYNIAAIPGSGNVPIVFTWTIDVAKFVAASLTLSKWDNETYVIGDKVTWHEFVKIAEEVKGTKFEVVYDSMDMLKSGQVTELPSHRALYQFISKRQLQGFFALFGVMFESGLFDFKPEHTINQDFPEIKAKTVRELMTEAWTGK